MQVFSLGINYSTGGPLIPPVDAEVFGDTLFGSLEQNSAQLSSLTRATQMGETFRGELKRRVIDLGDPRSAGWTILVNSHDPQKEALLDALAPLARQRGMKNLDSLLLYNGEGVDEWLDWLQDNYTSLGKARKPHYILIAGGPDQVPFLFQSFLSTLASVGRVAFDTLEDLKTYVDKIIRLETADSPVVEKETVFFAPDYGLRDPTFYSCHYMAKPLAGYVQEELHFKTQAIFGKQATKERLQATLRASKPAFVFTASHGLGAPDEPFETQKRVNGAICCQPEAGQAMEDWLFKAEDVPLDEPFLEGAGVFQFACYGYGTPAESDFAHWDPRIKKVNAPADFISALPKRLLAHPRGPLTYVGHVDVALLHGFTNPDHPAPALGEKWTERIEPFQQSIQRMLSVEPVSYALSDMSARYNICNASLTTTYDRLKKGKIVLSPSLRSDIASLFLTRSDAQNYMIFGDPGVCLRIPE